MIFSNGNWKNLCVVGFILHVGSQGWSAQSPYPPVERFGLFQAEFQAREKAENPYTDTEGEAVFTTPDGKTLKAPLFWDDGVSWKLRLSPDRVGKWTFRVRSSDVGLDGQEGAFDCQASERKGSIRPMKNHTNHFQYQNGDPVWFMGDTAWALYTESEENNFHRKQVEHHIDTRAAQGFNVMHSMLMSEAGWGNQNGLPFHDIKTEKINPAYWKEVDSRLSYLNSRGIIGGLAVAWGDKRKTEPFAWRKFPSVEARKRYARYIAARYAAYDVYFIVAGEWHGEIQTRPGATEKSIFREFVDIGDALAESDPHDRMIGIHPMTREGSVREFATVAWMSFGDYQQNYRDLHGRVLLSLKIGRPVVNSEYGYYLRDQDGDGATDKSNSFTANDMRHSSWDIVTAGGYFVTGFGTTYFGGNRDPGPFDVDASKNDDWESQIQYIKKFFEGLEWWKLTPADELVSSPSPRAGNNVTRVRRGNNRVEAIHPPERTYWAMAIPGQTYVLYCRGMDEEVSLEFDSNKGDFRSRLYNPRSGKYTESQNLALEKRYTFKPPDNQDWIVLLEKRD